MLNSNVKKVMLVVLMLVVIMMGKVYATDGQNIITIPGGNPTTNTETNTTIPTANTTTDTNVVLPSTTNTTNTATNTTGTTLPQTGETDSYVIMLIVAVCVVSAVYAYKKIRDYNIK